MSSTTNISERIPCGYSLSTIWVFDHMEKYKTFSVPVEKEVPKSIKMVMKVLSLYLAK